METKTVDKFRNMEKTEPQWLYNMRKNSWRIFSEAPLPDRVKNLWKYTDPEKFLIGNSEDLFKLLPLSGDSSKVPSGLDMADYSAYGYNQADLKTYAFVDPKLAEAGVIFTDLAGAMVNYENLIGNNLGRLVGSEFGKFEAMNTALWNTGIFIYIPDNTVVEKPIRVKRYPGHKPTFQRLLVMTGKNSQATVIDEYTGGDDIEDPRVNSAVELFIGDGSIMKYVNIQNMADKANLYVTQRARLERDARIFAIYGALGARLAKVNAGSILNGRGADSRMYGVAFAGDEQHFDYHTMHHHVHGDTYSNIEFKVVLKDTARSAYTGLIKINEDALNCQAFQENRNLLLNKGPKAESIPELEILCDQVQCSHGATMGPIDPEMIFYLTSRGYSREEAVKTIITGFVEPTIKRLPEDLQELLRGAVVEKLERN